MQWLIPVVMGLWAIWSWSQEQERERTIERARLAALYVNPFLSACEDLQSRIYHILELEGLHTLQERYPDGTYAEETLYLVARYFGWAVVLQRYSPYSQDPVVIRRVEAVRDAFAITDAKFPVGPFNFFHPEQKALGKIVMSRMEGQHGIEFDTISSYEFKARLTAPPLADSQSVRQSLEALRMARDAESLLGRQRLEKAQHHLVDLLHYLESKEGYRLFAGERRKCSYPEEGAALHEAPSAPETEEGQEARLSTV
ncbi:MAG: hypothetical protein AB7P69_21630 [Candidatus Binatia bacterium]